MKLTLRDLLWLALLAASLTAAGIQHSRTSEQVSRWRHFLGRQDFGPSEWAKQRQLALKKYAAFSDQQLDDELAALSQASAQWSKPEFEPCLTEMVRRGLVDRLQQHYDTLLARDKSREYFWHNLALLTALRRAQKQPDPLRIQVSLVSSSPPTIRATITSADVGRELVRLQHGGDYRGGRLERWRIVLTDEQGRTAGDSNFLSIMGGGKSSVVGLNYGQAGEYEPEMDLRAYVAPPKSGKYSLQVLYHNDAEIAGETDLAGLIITQSAPIAVSVQGCEKNPFQGVQSGSQKAIAIASRLRHPVADRADQRPTAKSLCGQSQRRNRTSTSPANHPAPRPCVVRVAPPRRRRSLARLPLARQQNAHKRSSRSGPLVHDFGRR